MARKRGLKWTRSTVAKAEGGQRELKAGELLLLTYVLRLRFEDLMPTADLVDLGLNLQQPNPNSQDGAERARSIPRATFKQVVPVSRDIERCEMQRETGDEYPGTKCPVVFTYRVAHFGDLDQPVSRE
jgi:hypothetical protein